MRFHFDPYEIFKKTPPPPAKVAKPAKPGDEQGGETGNFSNFSNFSRPIPGFLENSAPSPVLPSPAEDTPPAPVEPTAPDDDWHSAIPRDTMRRYIEKEQSTWTDERRQAQADEIQRIEEYRRQRGPRPSGPPAKLDRSEVFAAIGAVMNRLGAIWPGGLETDPQWQDRINAAAFVLQTAGPVAPGRPPALSPEEKEALHKRMWPTPPGKQEPKSTVPGPDIAKLVSKWPKNLRLEFAGRVGKYSNEMPINQAMSRAYNELKPDVEKNMP